MNLYIQGISGTFMAGLAVLAKEKGFNVRGVDKAFYPPMNLQLDKAGIKYTTGYDNDLPVEWADHVIVGNSLSRGLLQVESLLNSNIPYSSGPEWLMHYILQNKKVLAVAGTHGKTSTASMLLWILQYAKLDPGYLIGGVPNFTNKSAAHGTSKWFIVEADEYDSAFFDKRAKCLHLKPHAIILNNIEYDHADIYANKSEIEKVFKNWIKVLPSSGGLVCPLELKNVVKHMNDYTTITFMDFNWSVKVDQQVASVFKDKESVGSFKGPWVCQHMAENALAALLLSYQYVNLDIALILQALNDFPGVKRRLEYKGKYKGSLLYDDFAHHPTAIKKTINAILCRHAKHRVIVCLELGAYTLKTSNNMSSLVDSLKDADLVLLLKPEVIKSNSLSLDHMKSSMGSKLKVYLDAHSLFERALELCENNTVLITISSRDFTGVRNQLFEKFTL